MRTLRSSDHWVKNIKAVYKAGQGDLKPTHPLWGEKEYFV